MYKNASHRGHCATLNLCNDIETNPEPPIYGIDPTLTIKATYSQGDISTLVKMLENNVLL